MANRSRRKGGALTKAEIAIKERRKQSIELRKAGASYEMIGERLGVSTATAYKDVREGVQALETESADELRIIHYERLNHLLIGLWPRAQRGDLPAVDRVVGLMDRMSRLYGLDREGVVTESREVIVIDGGKDEYIKGLKSLKQTRSSSVEMGGGVVVDEDLIVVEESEQSPD